jgi:hypothetical protein
MLNELPTCFHEFSAATNVRINQEIESVYLFLSTYYYCIKQHTISWKKKRRFIVAEFVKLSDEPINVFEKITNKESVKELRKSGHEVIAC